MIITEILMALATIPFLFGVVFLNTESLFQGNFLEIYALLFAIYFLVSGLGLIITNHIKMNNLGIKKELIATLEFIFYMAVFALPGLGLAHYFLVANAGGTNIELRAYGRVAFVYLTLALSISPIVSLTTNKKISDFLISMRKTLGILSFLFFIRHGLNYFTTEYTFALAHTTPYFSYVAQNLAIRPDALTGIIAGLFMLVLGITSNKFSMNFLGGMTWKKIQSIAYPLFLITSIHVAFSGRFDPFYVLLILWVVYIRTIAYVNQKKGTKGGIATKYLCIPCGYIYDEALGDPDGGIAPGTKFADIPDSWVCPVCGATKASFEAYYDSSDNTTPIPVQTSTQLRFEAKIANYVMLTADVLELSLQVEDQFTILPGQYISLVLKDFDGEFSRSYSVVEYTGNIIKLGIKVKETGRAGRVFQNMKIGNKVKIKGVFGTFVLKETPNKKVFIGTGTGMSPLYSMIAHNIYSQDNMLFWGVRTQADLFYLDKFPTFKNLTSEFFLSQEEVQPYHHGRVDISSYNFPLDTEFYLCGNAPMVKEQTEFLKGRGYKNIYLEIF